MFYSRSLTKVHRPLPGVERRQAAVGDDAQLMDFQLAKGSVIPLHSHHNEQIGMVVSGTLVFTIGGDRTTLGPGDGYSIPPGVVHSVEVLEDSVVVDVFAPPREDYRD